MWVFVWIVVDAVLREGAFPFPTSFLPFGASCVWVLRPQVAKVVGSAFEPEKELVFGVWYPVVTQLKQRNFRVFDLRLPV